LPATISLLMSKTHSS